MQINLSMDSQLSAEKKKKMACISPSLPNIVSRNINDNSTKSMKLSVANPQNLKLLNSKIIPHFPGP